MRTKHTKLLDWLKTATDEAVAATGTTRGYLRQIGYGNKISSAEIATSIELATGGAVTRRELRPDDWSRIWPELTAA
ncbi:TPA: helix-turn-helix domain-containing protein [Pseudomonas putida]|uniref:transcriptional regulator n=1 Tax=Pseudomonas sp. HD6515 TaxID=2856556 RepID=UPI00217DC708|nr:helix-turn-helix domain-containing protein [Pseudomonas sp. HD6515]ELS0926024.1 helix-turn-helix domain-containing protein [Pseudomonas putida]UWH23462.1 helix-turn-helix domain-containing protein [Pseudomonas sp. HD6515]HDS0940912.1 helix-turn-helix domain-containing protein [Pseudomonas putida]